MPVRDIVMAAAGSSGASTVAYVSSSIARFTTSACTLTAPSGIQDGDMLVAIGFNTGSSVTMTSWPAGFAQQFSDSTTANALVIATKTASSESGNYAFTWSGASANSIAMLVYRGAVGIGTFGATTRATSATATAASITPALDGVLVSVFAIETTGATISTAPSGPTQRAAVTGGSNPNMAVYDITPSGTSATTAQTLVWSASAANLGVAFQLFAGASPRLVAKANTQNASTGASLVISKPTGTTTGDVMLAVMGASGGTPTWTGDTSWTEIADPGTVASGIRIAYKVAGASEGASYTFTCSTSAQTLSGVILTYRGAAYDTIGSLASSTSPITVPAVTASADFCKIVALEVSLSASATVTPPTSMAKQFQDADGTAPSVMAADETVLSGSSGTRSLTGASGAAYLVSIKPA